MQASTSPVVFRAGMRWLRRASVHLLRFTWQRQTLLTLLGILACMYALSVLLSLYDNRDLGIKTAFSTAVKGTRAGSITAGPEGLLPREGDLILAVGDIPIVTWPDFLNAPDKLNEATGANVRVTLRRGEDGRQYTALCRLEHLPWAEVFPSVLWFCLKITLLVVGFLVLWKRPHDRAAMQFYLLCIVTLAAYMGGYHWAHISTEPALLVGFVVAAVLLPAVTLHFYLVFPRPKRIVQRHYVQALLGVYGLPILFLAAILGLYLRVRGLYQSAAPQEETEAALLWQLRVIYVYFGLAALWYVASVASLLHSYYTVTDLTERNQVKCIFLGALLALVPIGYSLYLALFEQSAFGAGGATWPMFGASVCTTAAFIVSMTRYRLMDLDQIVSSGVIYFLISSVAGFAYYAVIFLGTVLFNQVMAGPPLDEAVRVSTTALVLLLLLDLARSPFQKALYRRFHREKFHLDHTLQRMGQAVEQLVDPPTLVQRLLHAASDLLGVSRGAVYLRHGGTETFRVAGWVGPAPVATEWPASGALIEGLQAGLAIQARPRVGYVPTAAQNELRQLGGEVAHPLAHEGKLLAWLLLGNKEQGLYRQEDINLLIAFAQITVLALQNAQGHQTIEVLNRDLQDKVDKIAEQQRRILTLQSQLRRLGPTRPAPSLTATSEAAAETAPAAASPASGTTAAASVESEPQFEACKHIVGSSVRVRQLLQLVRKVSATEAVVLLRGESGTGKELLAQAIHELSPRAAKVYVKVHCAALTPTLLESELFGHVKGAFTGAINNKTGRFEMADGGTLFLDEIGDISLEVQTKLLRVLQERTFERVGSSEPVKADVRIIAATHQNLEELIRHGRFREDLYYRLNVLPIQVPPLRERKEDIQELALYFLRRAAERCKKPLPQLDDDALAALKGYAWPGNIRQLENVLERAVVICEGPLICAEDLSAEVRQPARLRVHWLDDGPAPQGHILSSTQVKRTERQVHERDSLQSAMDAAEGNKAEAARALGIARSTLVSRLKKHGLL